MRRISDAQPTSRSPLALSAITVKKYQQYFKTLSTNLRQYQVIDQNVNKTVLMLNSLASDFVFLAQSAHLPEKSARGNYLKFLDIYDRWTRIVSLIKEHVSHVNEANLQGLIGNEMDQLLETFEQVHQRPPSTHKLAKDNNDTYEILKSAISEVQRLIEHSQIDNAQKFLKQLKIDISHKYDGFFRLSQINKTWKLTIMDECRANVEGAIHLLSIMKLNDQIAVPEEVEHISTLFNKLLNESSIDTVSTSATKGNPVRKTTPAAVKKAPMKPIATEEARLLQRGKQTGNPATRSKSAPSKPNMSNKTGSKLPTRRPAQPHDYLQQKKVQKETPVTPLQQSPKINTQKTKTHTDQAVNTPTPQFPDIQTDSSSKTPNSHKAFIVPLDSSPKIDTIDDEIPNFQELNDINESGSESEQIAKAAYKTDNITNSPILTQLQQELNTLQLSQLSEVENNKENQKKRIIKKLQSLEDQILAINALKSAEINLNAMMSDENDYIKMNALLSQADASIATSVVSNTFDRRLIDAAKSLGSINSKVEEASLANGRVSQLSEQFELLINRMGRLKSTSEPSNQTLKEFLENESKRLNSMKQIFDEFVEIKHSIEKMESVLKENDDLQADLNRFRNNLILMNRVRADKIDVPIRPYEEMNSQDIIRAYEKMADEYEKCKIGHKQTIIKTFESIHTKSANRCKGLHRIIALNDQLISLFEIRNMKDVDNEIRQLIDQKNDILDGIRIDDGDIFKHRRRKRNVQ